VVGKLFLYSNGRTAYPEYEYYMQEQKLHTTVEEKDADSALQK
jgi:hypothetical protein